MNQLDNRKVETLFNLPPNDWEEQREIENIKPFIPDPLLLTAENIADILQNFQEE